jgi:uncharacterized repeat protein (TIGR01451 family)
MGRFPSVSPFSRTLSPLARRLAGAAAAATLMLGVAAVNAADGDTLPFTSNQSCDAIQATGAASYDQTVECRLSLSRPAQDTSSEVIRLGIFFPPDQPGVSAWIAEGFVCNQQAAEGQATRLLCTGTLAPGSTLPIRLQMHLKGSCGAQTGIRSQVNRNGTLSTPTDTTINFPACAGSSAGAQNASTSVNNQANAAAQNNTNILQVGGSASSVSSTYGTYSSHSSSSAVSCYCSSASSLTTSSSSLSIISLSSSSVSSSSSSAWSSVSSALPECSDGRDNDGDGSADQYDFSCSGPYDNDETNPKAQCQDGIDNDGDGQIDRLDAGCLYPQDNDEYNQVAGYQASTYVPAPATATATVNVNVPAAQQQQQQAQQPYLVSYGPQYPIQPLNASPRVDAFGESGRLIAAAFPGSVTMTKRADRSEANPGDEVWYTITVRNNSDASVSGLTLDDRFTASDLTVTEAGGGLAAADSLQWLNGNLQPRETKTLRYRVRLSAELAHGYTVHNRVTLSGGGLSSPLTAEASIGIMRHLPQTGAIKLKPLFDTTPPQSGWWESFQTLLARILA